MVTPDWVYVLIFLIFLVIIGIILYTVIIFIKKAYSYILKIIYKLKDKKNGKNILTSLKQIIFEPFNAPKDNSLRTDAIQQIEEQQQHTTDDVMSEADHDDIQNAEVVQEQQQAIPTIENCIIMTKQPEAEEKLTGLEEKTSPIFEENNNICEEFAPLYHKLKRAKQEISKQVFGMENVIDQCFIALLSGGHVLCEGLPGTAKTTLAKAFAQVVSCHFRRCQFSPDLLPSDLIGDRIFNQKTNEFDFRKGPVFTQILLADEINRSPAKTQAALLEAMQESQVTVFGEQHFLGAVTDLDHKLPSNRIFFTIATQNPIEHEGTYRLPEAQLDRFMFRLFIHYPTRQDELAILRLENGFVPPQITPCISARDIVEWRSRIDRDVHVPDDIMGHVVDLIRTTREHKDIRIGAGPRASQVLLRGAKVRAAMRGCNSVCEADVKALAFDVLNHRIELETDVVFDNQDISPLDILRKIIDETLITLQNKQ